MIRPDRRIRDAVIEAVDLLAAKAENICQRMRDLSGKAEIILIHNSAPVCHDQRSALSDKFAQLLFNSSAEHVEHGSGHDAVTVQLLIHIDHVHIDPVPAKRRVGFHGCFMVIQAIVARSLGILHSPAVLNIIQHCRLCLHFCSGSLLQQSKQPARLFDLPEDSRVIAAVMIDHGTVEFLTAPPALPDLEILGAVRAMGNGLKRLVQEQPRILQLADALPVGRRRTRFHHQERLVLQAPHIIVLHA